jgi:hypothetical protein
MHNGAIWVIEQTGEFRSRTSMGRLLRLRSIRQSTCNTAEISFGLSSSFAANQTQLAATLCKGNPKQWRLGLQNNDELLLFEGTSFQVLISTKERSSRKLNDRKSKRIEFTGTIP